MALVLLLLGAGVIWGLNSNSPSPSNPSASKNTSAPSTTNSSNSPAAISPSTTPPQPAPQLLTRSGLTQVLAQMRTTFADTLGYQLNVYQDKAVLERPDTANAHKIVKWIYRDGAWANRGASTAVSSFSAVGDLSKFDVQAVLGVLKGAPETLHLYDSPETFLTIESLKDGSLYLDIHVSDATRRSGPIVVATDGSVKEISRPPR